MTSRNLFFKLMKEDFKRRLWVVTLISLVCFFLYPVAAAFMAGSIKLYAPYFDKGMRVYQKNLGSLISFGSGVTAFGMSVASLICGLSSFSYLNSRSKVDFYHGIPVRREKLYLANYLMGILYVAVPYGLCMAMAVIVAMANQVPVAFLWPMAVEGYFLHLVYYILMYTVVVIAAMMTGNLVVAILGTGVFNFVVPLASALIHGYFIGFYHTFVYIPGETCGLYEWGIRVSPLVEYITRIGRYDPAHPLDSLAAALAALGISLVLAVAGCMLYRKRPSEAAGKAMAFAVSMPVIRIILTLVSGMGGGAFFWGIRESLGWAVFGILCGTVICHCVVEIIYHFDFKKLFSDKLQLAGCIVVVMAVFCVFRYDLTGYDEWVPAAGKVKETAIYVNRLNQWVSYGELTVNEDGEWSWSDAQEPGAVLRRMHYQDVENTLGIVREGVRQVEEMRRTSGNRQGYYMGDMNPASYDAYSVSVIGGADGPTSVFVAGKVGDVDTVVEEEEIPETETWSEIYVCYTMNSGRKIYRRYHLYLERVLPRIRQMMADSQYQKGAFPVMNRTGEQVASVRYREGEDFFWLTDLTGEQKAQLLAAYQQEFGALTLEQMYKEAPIGLIRFTTAEEDQGMQWIENQETLVRASGDRYRYRQYGVWNKDYYPVYPSFTQTLKLLAQCQVYAGSYYKNMEIDSIHVSSEVHDVDGDWWDTREAVFSKPEDIRKLLDVLVDSDLMYYNPCYQSDPGYRGTLNYESFGESNSRGIMFPMGKVPEFVEERLE